MAVFGGKTPETIYRCSLGNSSDISLYIVYVFLVILELYEYIREHIADTFLDILPRTAASQLVEYYGVYISAVFLHQFPMAFRRRSA